MPHDLSDIPTEALVAELHARGAIVHPDDPTIEAHALLTRLSEQIGFTPPPASTDELTEWLDTVLDSPLAPRGGPAWQRGHEALLDAFDAALAGNEPICARRLADARAAVEAHGNSYCRCLPLPPLYRDAPSGRLLCVKCHRRRR